MLFPKSLMKNSNHHLQTPTFGSPTQKISMYQDHLNGFVSSIASKTIVCNVYDVIRMTHHSFFPYFMLVAFEAHGGFFRAFLLLMVYPLLWLLPLEIKLRVMIFITFCGLSLKDMDWIQRAVLPKYYLDDLNYQAYELFSSAHKRVIFTTIPRVMVEGFVKSYLSVDHVSGTELHRFGSYFTGFLTDSGLLLKHKALRNHFGEEKPDEVVAFKATTSSDDFCDHDHDRLFLSYFKEDILAIKQSHQNFPRFPRGIKQPKPIIFHDGKLAFLPTPSATLCMFMWLPMGFILSILRSLLSSFLPYKINLLLCSFLGMHLRLNNNNNNDDNNNNNNSIIQNHQTQRHNKVLYVCNHRTLLDPIYLSSCIGKPLTAVTYSISRISETLSIVRTARLTRERKQDKEKIRHLLEEDDVVILPEGTTCREPYLLRFSPLFAELTDDIVPVAMKTRVSMFYANTANGFKGIDSFYFLMNPQPSYDIWILEKLPKEFTCGGGGKSSIEVANDMQRRIGEVLGFECTSLTRKDKYMLLAGNQGLVN